MGYKWLEWAKQIQAISQAGLAFSKDVYDLERYEQLRNLSVEIMNEYTGLEMKKIKDLFANETGYQTPKLDIRAAVFRNNQILMVKEKIDNCWSLPGGFCDIGLSPSENIVKEVMEESGFQTLATRLLAVLDNNKQGHPPQPYHYYKLMFQCEIIGGEATLGIETEGVHFFSEDNLPELSLPRNTKAQIKLMFEFLRNPEKTTVFD